jgi:hypothetical protein
MSTADDDEAAARRYRAWSAVHDRRTHRRVCDELDDELGGQEQPKRRREAQQDPYPMVYYSAPGRLYDEKNQRFYRG